MLNLGSNKIIYMKCEGGGDAVGRGDQCLANYLPDHLM